MENNVAFVELNQNLRYLSLHDEYTFDQDRNTEVQSSALQIELPDSNAEIFEEILSHLR